MKYPYALNSFILWSTRIINLLKSHRAEVDRVIGFISSRPN